MSPTSGLVAQHSRRQVPCGETGGFHHRVEDESTSRLAEEQAGCAHSSTWTDLHRGILEIFAEGARLGRRRFHEGLYRWNLWRSEEPKPERPKLTLDERLQRRREKDRRVEARANAIVRAMRARVVVSPIEPLRPIATWPCECGGYFEMRPGMNRPSHVGWFHIGVRS